jgi:hypothetical protein
VVADHAPMPHAERARPPGRGAPAPTAPRSGSRASRARQARGRG